MFSTDRGLYTPRQLYQLGGTPDVTCDLIPPAVDLAASAYYHWVLDVDADSVVLPVIPDGALDLVLCPTLEDFAALYHPVDRAFALTLEGPIRYVGTCLRLERFGALFAREPEALRALAPGAETVDVLALEPLIERLGESADVGQIGLAFDEFLRARVRYGARNTAARTDATLSLFERFLDAIEPEHVADIARSVGISERQLRRETHRLFGLAPKKIQRIVRSQRAIGELVGDAPSGIDYHDDSHRIRELRALTGCTPGEIRRLAGKYNTRRR